MELDNIRSFQKLKELDPILAGQVLSVCNLVYETINSISRHYDNYTMHDMNHGIRVLKYMEELAFGLDDEFDKKIINFNAFELSLMILSAILHDIGMFIRPQDKDDIKANKIKYTNSLTFDGVLNVCKDETEAIKEIVRLTHAARIREFIDYDINGQTISKLLLVNGNYPYADDVALICQAHGEDYSYVKNLRTVSTKGSYTYNLQYIAVLLRIADYIDLDKQRTPILWYTMMNLSGFSRDEWEKHFIIQNEKKLRRFFDNKLQIYFDGRSSNAKIHRKYLAYIDGLRKELENADALLNYPNAEKKYIFNVSTKIDDSVQTEGFTYSDLRLNLDYSSITNLLMGENIYGDKRLGLRELVQNSIDACELMREATLSEQDMLPDPSIYIIYSKTANYVKVKDTGIGMTLDVVKQHFLNVGKSYYRSNEYLYKNYSYIPIGRYGIGFLACFLLSDNVTVKTKYYKKNEVNQIELEKNSEYVVTNSEETTNFSGTEITLDYSTFFSVFSDESDVISFLERYFLTDIPIFIRNVDETPAYKQIQNCCKNVVYTALSKASSRSKYSKIDISNYSKELTGEFYILPLQKSLSLDTKEVNFQATYLYNSKTNIFELITGDSLKPGFYDYIYYSNIDQDDYHAIIKAKKSIEKKRTDILALSKKNNKSVILLIDNNDIIDVPFFDEVNQVEINGKSVCDILDASGLSYYPELFEEYSSFYRIYTDGSQYVFLKRNTFESYFRLLKNKDDFDKSPFFLYVKGIYVSTYGLISCELPYLLKTLGFINYTGNDVKLDVSRNHIINGFMSINNELALVILKYMNESYLDSRPIISSMIDFLERNKKNLA